MILATEATVLAVLGGCVVVAWLGRVRGSHPSFGAAVLALAVGVLALAPLASAVRRRATVDLTEPTVFVGWAVWFPLFAAGGVSLALRWTEPFYLTLVTDSGRALMVAQLWGAVGFVAFVAGATLGRASRLSERVSRRLPIGALGPGRATTVVLWVTVGAGAALTVGAVATGRLGYDTSGTGASSPVIAYAAMLLPLGSALLWYRSLLDLGASVRRRITVGGILLAVNVGCGLSVGSRAALATVVLSGLLLALLARPDVGRRVLLLSVVLGGLALFVGLLVVSSYRTIRYQRVLEAQQTRTTASEGGQLHDLRIALDDIGARGAGDNLIYVRDRLTERLDLPGAFGLVAVRYPELRTEEREAGTRGTVVNGVVGAFVPRAVWASKPATSDPNALGRVYFDFDNAYAMSAMGDVLRDLGPLAVPLAMLVMGVVVGTTYTVLRGAAVIPDRLHPARTVLWVVLVVRSPAWFEGFYATYLADLVRVGLLGLMLLFVLHRVEVHEERRSP